MRESSLELQMGVLIAWLSPRHLFEHIDEPEARLDLALLRAEDAMVVGAAAADYIFGAAPNACPYRDARVGVAVILHDGYNILGFSRGDEKSVESRKKQSCSP